MESKIIKIEDKPTINKIEGIADTLETLRDLICSKIWFFDFGDCDNVCADEDKEWWICKYHILKMGDIWWNEHGNDFEEVTTCRNCESIDKWAKELISPIQGGGVELRQGPSPTTHKVKP